MYFHFDLYDIIGIMLLWTIPSLLGMVFAARYQKGSHKSLWLGLWSAVLFADVLSIALICGGGTRLRNEIMAITLYLSCSHWVKNFNCRSIKSWCFVLALFWGAILLDVDDVDVSEIYLFVSLAVILTLYFKNAGPKPLKILWFILWLCNLATLFVMDDFCRLLEYPVVDACVLVVFCAVIYFAKVGKKFCWVFFPLLILGTHLFGYVSNLPPPLLFGNLVDSRLTPKMLEENRGTNFELVIRSADAWNNNSEITFIQSRGDSSYICHMTDPCYIDEKDKNSCQWELMDSAAIAQVPSLIQSIKDYQQEESKYVYFDGWIFQIKYYDFKKGTRRYLEIGNAGPEVPNAFALFQQAVKWLPPQDTSAAYRAEVQKCMDNANSVGGGEAEE